MPDRADWGWLAGVAEWEVPGRWRSPEFQEELRAWVGEVAAPVVAMEPAKLRPWAAVWRVSTTEGVVYAKQNSPGQRFEAALVAELGRLAPAYVVPVVAVDDARGLLLTPDQGAVFADTSAEDLDAWCRLVVRATELGRVVADHTARLRSTGVTGYHVPTDLVDPVGRLAEEAALPGLPGTLVHNDLHVRNAFDRPGGLVLFDFADAVLAHPLCELLVPLEVLADRLGDPGPDDPRLRRVADAALEVWSDVAPPLALRRALPAALRLGRLARAESWSRLVPDLTGRARAEFGRADVEWRARLPDPPPVRFA